MSIIYPLATRAGIGLAAALALSVGAAHALISDLDRFELFNNCGPVSVSVEDLAPDAAKIGLTKDSLQAAVESRLRTARLYDPAYSPPFLYLRVTVLRDAASVNLEFRKMVCDSTVDWCAPIATWRSDGIAVQLGDAGYLRSIVSEKLDKFLVEYLRVNENACTID